MRTTGPPASIWPTRRTSFKKGQESFQCQSNFFPSPFFLLKEKMKSPGFEVHLKLKYGKGNGMSASLACVKHNRRSSLVDSNGTIQFLGSHGTPTDRLHFTTPLFLIPPSWKGQPLVSARWVEHYSNCVTWKTTSCILSNCLVLFCFVLWKTYFLGTIFF